MHSGSQDILQKKNSFQFSYFQNLSYILYADYKAIEFQGCFQTLSFQNNFSGGSFNN